MAAEGKACSRNKKTPSIGCVSGLTLQDVRLVVSTALFSKYLTYFRSQPILEGAVDPNLHTVRCNLPYAGRIIAGPFCHPGGDVHACQHSNCYAVCACLACTFVLPACQHKCSAPKQCVGAPCSCWAGMLLRMLHMHAVLA